MARTTKPLVGSKTNGGGEPEYFAKLAEPDAQQDAVCPEYPRVKVGPPRRLVDVDLYSYNAVRHQNDALGRPFNVTLFEHEARRLVRDLLNALDA